jgi:hypothetical protein
MRLECGNSPKAEKSRPSAAEAGWSGGCNGMAEAMPLQDFSMKGYEDEM